MEGTPNRETLGHRVGSTVRDGYSLWPLRETVNAGEQIHRTIGGRQGTHKIDVDMIEPCVRGGEGTERGHSVMMDFCSLTLETRTSPSPDITVDTRPHKTAGHKPLSCTYSRMREVMESIKNSSAETLRYIWPLDTSQMISCRVPMEFVQNGVRSQQATWQALDRLSVPVPTRESPTTGEEVPMWRAFALERERASAAVLAEPGA